MGSLAGSQGRMSAKTNPPVFLPLHQLENARGLGRGAWSTWLRVGAPDLERWSGGWNGSSGLEKRARPDPGRLAMCAHPAPANVSCEGHTRSQRGC